MLLHIHRHHVSLSDFQRQKQCVFSLSDTLLLFLSLFPCEVKAQLRVCVAESVGREGGGTECIQERLRESVWGEREGERKREAAE